MVYGIDEGAVEVDEEGRSALQCYYSWFGPIESRTYLSVWTIALVTENRERQSRILGTSGSDI